MKKIRYALEAFYLNSLFAFLRLLPLDTASAFGGALVRLLGPLTRANAIARANIAYAFPELDAAAQNALRRRMWDNLGRTFAEFAFLNRGLFDRVKVEGQENLPQAGEQALFFSGHLGNWELTYPVAHHAGVPVALVYRHANNPYIEKRIVAQRAAHCTAQIAKGPRGGMGLMKALKQNMSLALLVDQKMNQGVAVPFFGRTAMTAPAIAEMALRFDMPIIPARVIRTGGAHFRAIIYPPLAYEKTGDKARDVLTIMAAINAMIEGWIREYPEQWFWVHRRWPKEAQKAG